LVDETPIPLEFQTAIPLGEGEADYYRELAGRMAQAWTTLETRDSRLKAKRPKPVEPLTKLIDVASLLPPLGSGEAAKAVPVGINDLNRESTLIEFGAKGPNLLVLGPPVTGKTMFVRSLALALAHLYPPDKAAFIFLDPSDPSRRFYNFGSSDDNRLDKLPHVLGTAATAKELDEIVRRLRAEYDEEVIPRLQGQPDYTLMDNKTRTIFIIADHWDDAETVFNKSGAGINGLAEVGKGKNMHIVISGTTQITRSSSDELRRRVESSRYTLVLNDFETVRYMGVRAYFAANKELPPGRGFLVKAVSMAMVQAAMPYAEGKNGLTGEEQIDQLFGAIRAANPVQARWSYHAQDLAPLEAAIRGETPAQASAQIPNPAAAEANEALDVMAELMKMQAAMAEEMASLNTEVDPSQMVAKEFADVEPGNGAGPEAAAEAVEEGGGEKKGKRKK